VFKVCRPAALEASIQSALTSGRNASSSLWGRSSHFNGYLPGTVYYYVQVDGGDFELTCLGRERLVVLQELH
jgi:hypothetical protein